MKDNIVLDVELKTRILAQEDWKKTNELEISCAVVYEEGTGKYLVYDDTAPSRIDLCHRITAADRITGYNIWNFDLPVIFRRPPGEKVWELADRTNDLLRRIWASAGHNPDIFDRSTHGNWGLDKVCRGTLGEGKTGTGVDAPVLYANRRLGELYTYCINDVRLEAKLGWFMDQFGYVVRDGVTLEIIEDGVPRKEEK